MAYLWEDSFNRADGAPGNGWTIKTGTWALAGGKLKAGPGGAQGLITQPDSLAGPDYTAELTLDVASDFDVGSNVSICVRNDNTVNNYYAWRMNIGSVGAGQLSLFKVVAGVQTVTIYLPVFNMSIASHKLALRVVGQTLYCYLDDVLQYVYTYTDLASGLWFAIRANPATAKTIYFNHAGVYDTNLTAMSVTPIGLVANSPDNTLELNGFGTSWTPGTPGSPIFTATAGTITAQTIDDIGHATLAYTAPALPQVVTFDDPDSHAACQVGVQVQIFLGQYTTFYGLSPVDYVQVPGQLGQLITWLGTIFNDWSPLLLQIVDPTGRLFLAYTLLQTITHPDTGLSARILDSGDDRLSLIHGDTAGSLSGITEALVQLGLIRGPEYYTLPDVIAAIAAIPPPLEKPWAPVVYPGIAHITYSDLVLFDSPATIPGPMNGAHCLITSVPPQVGSMGTGYGKMYWRIGRYSFVDDQGYHEPWEYLTFAGGNLVPSRLRQASELVIQCVPGVEGSVHPYLIDS